MCGCLFGSLAQAPQQNVFQGLPIELMPEEATLLVEIGAAYVVEDTKAHKAGLTDMKEADKQRYLQQRQEVSDMEWSEHLRVSEEKRQQFLAKSKAKGKGKEKNKSEATEEAEKNDAQDVGESATDLFAPEPEKQKEIKPVPTLPSMPGAIQTLNSYHISTSSLELYHKPTPSGIVPAADPNSYSLYKYLHSRGYFLSPGLRFGCQFVAYPGDPLRYHSHFICRGLGWDEEIDLIDIVGGGRLGTGVKKSYMFGGKPTADADDGETRVFCVEWGGF